MASELLEAPAVVEHEAHEHPHDLAGAIIIGLVCLGLSFTGGHILEKKGVWWLPEAGLAVLLGTIAALVFELTHIDGISSHLVFDFEFFMIWLLPPIIFEAGFNMNQQTFLDAALPMLSYAFLGTTISTFVVGGIVFGASNLGWCEPLGGIASLTFGALISATDPVTVLSVFQALGVQPDLFALVFGESVMNDAIALVLARTFVAFRHTEVTALSVLGAVGIFLYTFCASTLAGILFGAASAYGYKLLGLADEASTLFLETALSVVAPWLSFYVCEVCNLSGIVAILFCGMAMARYVRPNLSRPARVLTARAYKTIATVCETYIFVYLGMAAFAMPILKGAAWWLAAISLVACLLGRAANIGLVSLVLRAFGTRVPLVYQAALFASGLRGGVAFAIASLIYEDKQFGDADAELHVLQTTLIIAAFTIFVFGGAIEPIAHALGVLHPDGKSDLHQQDFEHTPETAPWSNKGHTWVDRLDAVYIAPLLTRRAYASVDGAHGGAAGDGRRRGSTAVNLRAKELGVDELELREQPSEYSLGGRRHVFARMASKLRGESKQSLTSENARLKARVAELEATISRGGARGQNKGGGK